VGEILRDPGKIKYAEDPAGERRTGSGKNRHGRVPALMGIDITGSLKTGIPRIGAGTPQDTIRGVYGGPARKGIKAISAAERGDYFRALRFASPAFIEAVLKAYRLTETGDHAQGEFLDRRGGEAGPPGGGRGGGQAAGFRPETLARAAGEYRTTEIIRAHFKEKRDDLYSRYRLLRTPEEKLEVIRDMQRFNMETRKYRGVIPPITGTSMGQAARQKPEKPFMGFGRMIENNP
jgi:hypothetical protein